MTLEWQNSGVMSVLGDVSEWNASELISWINPAWESLSGCDSHVDVPLRVLLKKRTLYLLVGCDQLIAFNY